MNPYDSYIPQKPPKVLFPTGKGELLFALGCLVSGLMLINSVYVGGFQLGFAVAACAVLGMVLTVIFVVLSEGIATVMQAPKDAFEETVERMGKSIQLSAAIGSAVCDPKKDISYDAVFERADAEMYQRKQEQKKGMPVR